MSGPVWHEAHPFVRNSVAPSRGSPGAGPDTSGADARPDYHTTELCCRALARCRDRYGDQGALRYDEALARGRRFILTTQRKDLVDSIAQTMVRR